MIVAAALALPARVGATPTVDDLKARAVALDEDGYDAEAAALWEQIVAETDDDDIRLIAYARAVHAWERAHKASGQAIHLCAATSILARALADERIADEGRRELAAHRPTLEAHAIDCTPADPPPALAAVESTPPRSPPPPSSSSSSSVDAPKRPSPRTIVGAGIAGLAAASLGGFIYAAAADRAIVRGYRRLGEQALATGTYNTAEAKRLDAEGPLVRDLMIGFGLTTAALTGAAVALLVTGRRPRRSTTRSLSVLPQARPDLGGVAITGRF